MIEIKKSEKTGEYYIVTPGFNGEPLAHSEMLKTKQAAIKNLNAQMDRMVEAWLLKQAGGEYFIDTTKKAKKKK